MEGKAKTRGSAWLGKDACISNGVLLLLGLVAVASLVFSAFSFATNQRALQAYRGAYVYGETDDGSSHGARGFFDGRTHENGAVIDGRYTIDATERISRAYLAGDTSKLSVGDREMVECAAAVLDEVILPEMSEFEKEQAVYEWLCDNILDATERMEPATIVRLGLYTPQEVLKVGAAESVGFSTTFRLFMEMCGIPCMVIHDEACDHAWNLVELDDGWYHVDAFADAGADEPLYLNLNDDMMSAMTGLFWDAGFFPAADGTAYLLTSGESEVADGVEDVADIISEILEDPAPGVITIRLGHLSENDLDLLYLTLDSLSMLMRYSGEFGDLSMSYAVSQSDGGYVLTVVFERVQGSGGSVFDLFGDYDLGIEGWDDMERSIFDSFGFAL